MASAVRRAKPRKTDPLSDQNTSLLIRRVLCPHQLTSDWDKTSSPPIDELLPPLTSRNDVDLQLYAIIAIIIRDYVQVWYGSITPDENFVGEVVQTIAHCTRLLEQRLRKIDLETLLLDEIPSLVDKHVETYRLAHRSTQGSLAQSKPRQVYHTLWALPYLEPVPISSEPATISCQAEKEAKYRQMLGQAILAVLLPTEDLENECLTTLVGQILSEVILCGMVANKAAEPWVIWAGLTSLFKRPAGEDSTSSREISSVSRPSTSSRIVTLILTWLLATTTILRLVAETLLGLPSLPRRKVLARSDTTRELQDKHKKDRPPTKEQHQDSCPRPIVACSIWHTSTRLLELDRRMPWLSGSLSMLQWLGLTGPGRVAAFDGVVDRLLSENMQQHLLSPAKLPGLLRAVRGAIFPNNMLPGGPAMLPPETPRELLQVRRQCAVVIWSLIPRPLGRLLFGNGDNNNCCAKIPLLEYEYVSGGLDSMLPSDPAVRGQGHTPTSSLTGSDSGSGGKTTPPQQDGKADLEAIADIEETILDVFGDSYCNKHLVYSILELVLVRLMPEMALKGPSELWAERLD